ncbi:MAG: energy transducer TonB [Verrucomicrobiia bacterium]|jgi:TonB family protein
MRRVPKLSFAQGQLMLWILAGSLVAFGSMFLFFRVSGVSLMTAQREVPRINFMPTRRQDPLLAPGPAYVVADVFDPSLMSLPSAHGFSKRVWARKIEAGQRDLGWNQTPSFLGVTAPGLPAPLLQPVPVDAAVLAAAEKTPALSEEVNDQEVLEPPLSINQSVFRVLSALEDRSVVYAPPLPTIKGLAPLTPTQVRVGVDADGLVPYVLLDRSSGDDTVDAQVLELARQFRFEAEHDSGPSSLTWGVLRFLWTTQSVLATNSDSAATPH